MKNHRLVSPDIEPGMIINRRTAGWYLPRLRWRALYYLGLFEFMDENYKTARSHWTNAFKLSEQRQDQHKSQLGSMHRRLMNACRGKRFIATRREMDAFNRSDKERLKLMLADFYALWLRWNRAETLYRRLLDKGKLLPDQKAVVLRCLAQRHVVRGNKEKARKLLKRVLELDPDAPSTQQAYYRLALNAETTEGAVQHFRRAHDVNPQTRTATLSLYQAGTILWNQGRFPKARATMRKVAEQYPETYWAKRAKDALQNIEEKITMEGAAIKRLFEAKKDELTKTQRQILEKKLQEAKSGE
ncbi:MAG: tetratricopeptide repeat protein [Lentisphaeria bacterium]